MEKPIKLFTEYYPNLKDMRIEAIVGVIFGVITTSLTLADLDDVYDIKRCIDCSYDFIKRNIDKSKEPAHIWLSDQFKECLLYTNGTLYLSLGEPAIKPYASFVCLGIEVFIYPQAIAAFKHKDVLFVKCLE